MQWLLPSQVSPPLQAPAQHGWLVPPQPMQLPPLQMRPLPQLVPSFTLPATWHRSDPDEQEIVPVLHSSPGEQLAP